MIRLRKDSKFIIILVIVLISLYLGYRRSGIKKAFLPTPSRMNTSVADKMFNNLGNSRKVLLKYDLTEITAANEKFDEIIFADEITIRYSDIKENYSLQILEIHSKNFEDILKKLRDIEGLNIENIQAGTKVLSDLHIEESIQNNVIAKKRIKELIRKTTSSDNISRLKRELEGAQTKIDSLQNLVSVNSHYIDHDIFYINVIKNSEPTDTLKKASFEFILTTFIIMIILIISLLIFYYIYVALSSLMNALGIKSSRGGRGSSNYNYNYNKRSYGRKVKRIYKNADGTKEVKKN